MIRPRISTTTAKLEQTLLWYDGAQIVLLRRDSLSYVLAVAIDQPGIDEAFFGSLITIRQLVAYQQERFDLRYILARPDLRKSYIFPMRYDGEEIILTSVSRNDSKLLSYLPESGFFARSHDPIEVAVTIEPNAKEVFSIDGSWDIGEFSKLYGQIGDLYYTFNGLDRYSDLSMSDKSREKFESALSRPFRGGGSYSGYYADIANDNDFESQLRVSGIQYNSPGYVELRARQEPFDMLINLLRSFSEDLSSSQQAYNQLYRFLQNNKLLKRDLQITGDQTLGASIKSLSKELSDTLTGVKYETIYDIAHRDVLKSAKIILSIARRSFKLFEFFEQGRIQYAGLVVDPLSDSQINLDIESVADH